MSELRMLLSKTATSELKKQLREAGVRGYSKMKKAELVDLLHTSMSHRAKSSVSPSVVIKEEVEEIPPHLGGDVEKPKSPVAKKQKVKEDKPKVEKPKAEKPKSPVAKKVKEEKKVSKL